MPIYRFNWVAFLFFGALTAFATGIASLSFAASVRACAPEVTVSFVEAAPKDIFQISNRSGAGWKIRAVAIDLEGSRGKLLFDTRFGGPGENVYQPFEALDGQVSLASQPDLQDGQTGILLTFHDFVPGQDFRFTIDVDDQLATSDMGRTMISGAEIEGAAIKAILVQNDGTEITEAAQFDRQGRAVLGSGACS
ncbi:MAG: hypothetical protein ACPGOV_16425 [Magnetovibrionaceae bacterium]